MAYPWPAGDSFDRQFQDPIDYAHHVGVAFDRYKGDVVRFLVQLRRFQERVAQIDHNPRSLTGHDLRAEGLHVDMYRLDGPRAHVELPDRPLPTEDGALIRVCRNYLRENHRYFLGVYYGNKSPEDPPQP